MQEFSTDQEQGDASNLPLEKITSALADHELLDA
jgi:hypothetical protein